MSFASRCGACNAQIDSERIGLSSGQSMDCCFKCGTIIEATVFGKNEAEPGLGKRKPPTRRFLNLAKDTADDGNYRTLPAGNPDDA